MSTKHLLLIAAGLCVGACDTSEQPQEPSETPDRVVDLHTPADEDHDPPETAESTPTKASPPKAAEKPSVDEGDTKAGESGKMGDGVAAGELARLRDHEISMKVGDLGLHGTGRGGGGGISERGIGLANLGRKGRGGGARGGTGTGFGRLQGLGNARGPRDQQFDRESGTEAYTHHGTNKFTDASEDRLSTFAVDVDTGSYTIARRKLREGRPVPAAAVRVEEFVNYFGYDYPRPDRGAFSVSMEAAPSPFSIDGETYLMRVGVQGKTIRASERKPVHLTFLVDVSGSMQQADKIGLVKKSLHVLTDNLKANDTVAIATYAGRTEIVLQPTGMNRRQQIFDAIDRLDARGSTAMSSGLDLAYELAGNNFRPSHENRVIVLSDGDANVGRTGWPDMLKQIGSQVKKGVTLSTIGFGMGNYKDTLMEQLADHGNGNYHYVDSENEAQKIFGDQLDGTLQVIAKDVKIQVDFNPDAVRRYRLVGYENRDIADKDFRNDKVDAGEIGAGHTVTALYEVQLEDSQAERIATVRVRHKEPHGSDEAAEQSFAFDRPELKTSLATSSGDFQFAASVAAFAEKLRESPYAEKLTYDWILEIAEGATKGRGDRKEFVKLVKKARRV